MKMKNFCPKLYFIPYDTGPRNMIWVRCETITLKAATIASLELKKRIRCPGSLQARVVCFHFVPPGVHIGGSWMPVGRVALFMMRDSGSVKLNWPLDVRVPYSWQTFALGLSLHKRVIGIQNGTDNASKLMR